MPNLTGRPIYQKANRVVNPDFATLWALTKGFCYFCGRPWWAAERDVAGLTKHHLIRGTGRSDESCNLTLACHRCHDLAENRQIMVFGKLLPNLTLGMVLAVKLLRDPSEWDSTRLTVLRGQPLPDHEPVPQYFVDQWKRYWPFAYEVTPTREQIDAGAR